MITINTENLPISMREHILNMSESDLCDIIYRGYTKKSSVHSTEIGKKYELQIENILMTKFQTINSTQIPHSGDFIISSREHPNYRILIEAKNYTRIVPSTEIQKFYADIGINSNIHAAVFISANKVTGIEASVYNTIYSCGTRRIPIMFLSNMNTEIASDIIIGSIDMLFEYLCAGKNNQSLEALLEHTHEIWREISHIHSSCNELSRTRSVILNTKNTLVKQLDSVSDSLWHLESTFNRSVDQIRQLLVSMNPDNNPYGDTYSISSVVDTITGFLDIKLICKDVNIKSAITQIIQRILTRYQEIYTQNYIKIHIDSKNINILQESGSGFMRILQYKHKLLISLKHISNGSIKIPKCADYKSGWITFTIDSLNMRNVCDIIIHNFVSDFYSIVS